MKTKIEPVVNVLAAAIWADGVYADEERDTIKEIADDFGFSSMLFEKAVDAAVSAFIKGDDDKVNKILVDSAAQITKDEKDLVFEGVLEIILCDSVIAGEEVDRLLAIAEAMEIDKARAVMMMLDMANAEAKNLISLADVERRMAACADNDAEVAEALKIASEIVDKETFVVEL